MRHRDETSLVGWYFQSFAHYAPGITKVEWQGRVIGRPEPGWYLVQLCTEPDKSATRIELIKFERMSHWQFYPDVDAMKDAYEKIKAQEKEGLQFLRARYLGI
jgi:hypothetical protein